MENRRTEIRIPGAPDTKTAQGSEQTEIEERHTHDALEDDDVLESLRRLHLEEARRQHKAPKTSD
jgi:hypothetical protein